MLALIPLLSLPDLESQHELAASTLVPSPRCFEFCPSFPAVFGCLIIVSIAIVVVGGHYLADRHFVMSHNLDFEVFAAALML